MARVVRESALLYPAETGCCLGPKLPSRSFARSHPDPSSRGGCFRPAAVGVTQRPARAFHALAFPLAEFLFSEDAGFVLFRGGGASPNLRMPVKRSLKLDDLLEENSFDPSKITRKKSFITYSPTTGTCQMSLFASPTSSEEQKHRNRLSNVSSSVASICLTYHVMLIISAQAVCLSKKRKKLNHPSLTESKESTIKDNDELMMLLSKVEKLSEEIMTIMQNLSSIRALEGSRELENLIGISCASRFLKKEMRKTKELMTKVIKQKLFERSSGLPHKRIKKKCTHHEHQLLHLPDHI
ncbi:centromere protein R isoform X2 [Trachypithecus francoisi]|uniref:centromere protein R isoform X2 n=1 Tax=Trachypithecus francoisi TaxID=54180 RepID=UPI00141AF2FC|nr:centromere protein R isoform X2 [Trachypithecus francoisi]